MMIDPIIKDEIGNDGSSIHLYWDQTRELWLAYGYSAYSLRLTLKSKGYDSIRLYSWKMHMPCTMADDSSIKKIYSESYDLTKPENQHIVLHIRKEFRNEDYHIWENKLRDLTESVSTSDASYICDNMSSFSRNTKRIIDLFASGVALIVFSPVMLICCIAIKAEDGGPAIFKQERIGRFGKPFHIYKFRSMRNDAEALGPKLSTSGGEGDTRLTKVGAFLRAHHLDELPQLWNVFCGDMAFVGPRPERQFYIDQILEHDKRYTYLYQIRPGVTSYATLYNGYTDTMEKMLARLNYDLYYLQHRTLLKDFVILFKTFCKIIFGIKF